MPEKKNEKTGSIGKELFFWGQALVVAMVVLILFNVYVGRISVVDGSSMAQTLHNGDKILVRILGYDDPQRGDIVVVHADAYPNKPLIKRVIGIAGDTIDFDKALGLLILNGETVYEPYIAETMRTFGTMSFPFTVPEGHIFVMGDNRNDSSDSRLSAIGALPVEQVIGHAFFRILPFSGFGKI